MAAAVTRCQWCDRAFASHAELSMHQMYRDGNPRCPKYPNVTEDWGYQNMAEWKRLR